MFVHLAPEKVSRLIERQGIRPTRFDLGELRKGVFAMAVTPDFYVSHQWLRELRRSGARTIVGVYFRLPDDEPVHVAHYRGVHLRVTASEAVGAIMNAEDPEGFEVIVPRRVEPGEISKISALPQVVGWRYHPDAKGTRPCGCSWCQRGNMGSRKLRDAYERETSE